MFGEAILEFVGTESLFEGAVERQGDSSGLLGDDYDGGVGFTAEAQGGPMS